MSKLAAVALAMSAFAAPAFAQAPLPAPACAIKPTLGAEYAGWSAKAELASAPGEGGAKAAPLPVGKAYIAKMHPTPDVTYPVQPEKPGERASKGGLFSLTVDKPGTYFIALGTPPWIEVIKDDKALKPVTFGHGPECSGIRKMIDYALEPGTYLVEVAGSGVEMIEIMAGARP